MLFFTVVQLHAKCSDLKDQSSTSVLLVSKQFWLPIHIPPWLFPTALSGCAAVIATNRTEEGARSRQSPNGTTKVTGLC